MSAPVLRPANSADAARVAQLLLDSRRVFLPFAPLPHPDEDVRRWVRDELLPKGGVTVAEAAGPADGGHPLLGMLATATEHTAGVPQGGIEQLYLRPGATGQGLGTRLLQHALATLPAPVRLHTFQANSGARRFYERAGFVPVSFGDGSLNMERCPDVLYERWAAPGPRVQMRRLQPADLEAFCAYRGDEAVGRWQGWTPNPRAESLAFLQQMQLAAPLQIGEWLQLGIALKGACDGGEGEAAGRLIGDIGLVRHSPHRVEIGFTLESAAQGRGLAREALGLLLGWLWTLPDTQTVQASTDSLNAPSAQLLQRLGFTRVAEREAVFRGAPCVEWDYTLTRPAVVG